MLYYCKGSKANSTTYSKYISLVYAVLFICFSINTNTAQAEIDLTALFYPDEGTIFIKDPIEKVNRKLFEINKQIDKKFLYPLAYIYHNTKTEWVSEKVNNFIDNLGGPRDVLTNLLSTDLEKSITALWRFLINGSLGMLGFFDAATMLGIPKCDKSFEEVMIENGIETGPYLIMPVFGSSSVRGVIGYVIDSVLNPVYYLTQSIPVTLSIEFFKSIVYREKYIETKIFEDNSIDPYAKWRSIYTQMATQSQV